MGWCTGTLKGLSSGNSVATSIRIQSVDPTMSFSFDPRGSRRLMGLGFRV